jgi:predicted glycosyltransferase
MKRLLFYCQHILGMGHLVRSMEIVRGLTQDFEICFVNGGEVIENFDMPAGIDIINLPGIKTDSEFKELQSVDPNKDLAEVKAFRMVQLLEIYERWQPDLLLIELFPFGRRKFSFELLPLLDLIQVQGRRTKVVCSLRDIVVTKQNQAKHEQKVCDLINKYFDLVLVHGDPQFQPLEASFSRVADLTCPAYYTGFVVQSPANLSPNLSQNLSSASLPKIHQPLILTTVGGGRFGHELIDCVVATAPLLETRLPHHIQVFTGPFYPDDKFAQLQVKVANCPNITIDRFTPHLLSYMQAADLSISMSGYNTTMNVLTTGVRAMLLAFTGNQDQEQTIRAERLGELGAVTVIHPEELQPSLFSEKMIRCLQTPPQPVQFDCEGVAKTRRFLQELCTPSV